MDISKWWLYSANVKNTVNVADKVVNFTRTGRFFLPGSTSWPIQPVKAINIDQNFTLNGQGICSRVMNLTGWTGQVRRVIWHVDNLRCRCTRATWVRKLSLRPTLRLKRDTRNLDHLKLRQKGRTERLQQHNGRISRMRRHVKSRNIFQCNQKEMWCTVRPALRFHR